MMTRFPFVKALMPKAIGWTMHQMSYVSWARAGDLALYVFAKPRIRGHTPSEAAYLAKADAHHTVKFRGHRIVVYHWNPQAERQLLLLHGWESNAARWQPLIKRLLVAGYGILAPDAPAHGQSEGTLLNMVRYSQLIHQMVTRWKPKAIIGHSLGGSSACYYCSQHPDTPIEQLILMGVPSEFASIANYYGDILGLSPRMRTIMERRFEKLFDMTYEEASVAVFCRSVEVPTLVIHDEQDELSTTEDARRYHEALAQSELMLTDGLGHSLQGEVVYQRILAYLQTAFASS